MFNKLAFAVAAAAVLGVQAQSATSSAGPAIPSNISPCVVTCITQSLSAGGCSGIADLNCVCTSSAFQDAATQCLQSQCTDADVQAAQQLQQAQCAASGSGSSAASSAASTISSIASSASSAISSLSSEASSAASSISSAASSLSSSLSSARNSATGPSSSGSGTSGTGAANTDNAAGALEINVHGLVGLGVAVLGAVAGAGLVL